MYPVKDLQEAKLQLLSDTKMIDYTNEVYQQVQNTSQNLPGASEANRGRESRMS